MNDDEITLVELAVTGRDIGGYRLQCDRLACTADGTLLVAQVVAPAAAVKGFAGVLHNNGELAEIRLAKGQLTSTEYPHGKWVDRISRSAEGYARKGAAHLGYGVAHALFVARTPGLLPDASDEALWRELAGPRFTTPLLRPWLPWLREQLADGELLRPCVGHRTAAAVLAATTEDLDRLVERGIRQGRLRLDTEGRAA